MKRAKMVIVYRCLLFAVTGLAILPFVESSIIIDDSTPSGFRNCSGFRMNKGPLIFPCVSEIILQKGQNFTLICKGNTKLLFTHQDLSEEVTSNFNITGSSSSITEEEYSFQYTLNLYFVDQYAIGYYACSDYSVDENIVKTITEEPESTEHVSYIYLYVNGTDSLFAPMSEVIISRSNKILIECRPSTPDVEVKLSTKSQIKTPKYSPKIGFVLKKCDNNAYACQGFRGKKLNETKRIRIFSVSDPPNPQVKDVPEWFGEGDNFSINCTVSITPNTIAILEWTFPMGLNKNDIVFKEDKSPENITTGEIYNLLTIFNATEKHSGSYSCQVANSCEPKESNKVKKLYTAEKFLNMRILNGKGIVSQNFIIFTVEVESYPEANLTIFKKAYGLPAIEIVKDNILLDDPEKHYTLEFKIKKSQVLLSIKPLDITDTAEYIFFANNGYNNKTLKHDLYKGAEVKNYFPENNQTCVEGMKTTFKCDVFGYPLPKISWKLSYYNDTDIVIDITNSTAASEKSTSLYEKSAYLEIPCNKEGDITCIATQIKTRPKVVSKMRKLLVYEMLTGFGISTTSDNGTKWFLDNSQVSLKCLASLHLFSNVTWDIDFSKKSSEAVELSSSVNNFSHVAELKIMNINLNQAGEYTCVGVTNNGIKKYDHIAIKVLKLQDPVIEGPEDTFEEVYRNDDKNISCIVTGAPLPEIKWSKDGKPLPIKNTNSNVVISHNILNQTAVISTISITKMTPDNMGIYECEAVGQSHTQKSHTLKLKVESVTSNLSKYILIAIGLIILLLTILIVYLTLKVKKEKQFRKELAAAGLDHFKEGLVNSINPDLGIDEQAELLPYDERFEFPPEKLVYGKQLGAGAFGIVFRAEARGIINAEETTTVAVKMVKKTADNMYIKALASELKIMVHLGKHINIVNLLGACTKKVGKRELMVIVEYCMYGNIHNYMQRHREVFIDQLVTDNKEKLGKVNRAYSSTTGSTGMQSDYFGSTNTQDTDNTSLNTANTVRSGRKNIVSKQPMEEVKASEGMQPEWRSNYESDYSYDGRSPRPLTSRDLLAWAFQIARGMEYLASRKVLHGDLAARNILLAEDNIVKICDFGLAKSIYKNEEYQHKENSLLPVKWLAIECMIDRLFSTQSDVWAFGIVLWELFSLAKTPYPNINHLSLISFLSEGHRLSKPAYADDRLYSVMRKCWDIKPNLRPTFSELQEELGALLEDNVRTHYVALNSSYMDNNSKVEGQEDYLAMMNTPDYNNLVTPSPDDRYVNTGAEKRFFPPTPVKVDDAGYLQMSPRNQGIFSPRLPNSEFDFDPRKFNQKPSEASSCGSELTPMLTLNNLPARSGSESDHEGNAPYLNVCPRIEEEADEVFAPSLNDTKNAKNSAVTNPTYITFDNIDEKPKDIINSYVNINVPNGLVK